MASSSVGWCLISICELLGPTIVTDVAQDGCCPDCCCFRLHNVVDHDIHQHHLATLSTLSSLARPFVQSRVLPASTDCFKFTL
jgi:hypothetical protein